MNDKIEFLFAHWAVPKLKELRGPKWHTLVEQITGLSETEPDALAFALTMARLNGCVNCNLHRYRERGGCAECSRFVLTTLAKESEISLLTRFQSAQKEVRASLETRLLEKKAA